jgi:hypothetical protein
VKILALFDQQTYLYEAIIAEVKRQMAERRTAEKTAAQAAQPTEPAQ